MATGAQMTEHASNVAFLREALQAQPPEHLAARCGALLGDLLSADDLEAISNHLGRIGHEKARQQDTLTSG